VNHRVSAWGIQTELPVARLKPAVGEISRQASPKLRGLGECPICPEYKTHNTDKVRDRQQAIDLPGTFASRASGAARHHDVRHLAPGVYFARAATGVMPEGSSVTRFVATR